MPICFGVLFGCFCIVCLFVLVVCNYYFKMVKYSSLSRYRNKSQYWSRGAKKHVIRGHPKKCFANQSASPHENWDFLYCGQKPKIWLKISDSARKKNCLVCYFSFFLGKKYSNLIKNFLTLWLNQECIKLLKDAQKIL